jgi:hypothetical protein
MKFVTICILAFSSIAFASKKQIKFINNNPDQCFDKCENALTKYQNNGLLTGNGCRQKFINDCYACCNRNAPVCGAVDASSFC